MVEDEVRQSGQTAPSAESARVAHELRGARLWREVLEQPAGPRRWEEPESGTSSAVLESAAASDGLEGREPATVERSREGLHDALRFLAYGAALVGLPLVMLAAYADYAAGRFLLLTLWVLLYLPLLIPLIWPRIPHTVHAGIFVGFLYGVGVLSFLQLGYQRIAVPVLLFLPAFAALLLGGRAGLFFLLGVGATIVPATWLTGVGSVSPVSGLDGSWSPLLSWAASTLALFLLAGGLVLAADRLRRRLSLARDRELELIGDLDDLKGFVAIRTEKLACQAGRWEALGALAELAVSIVSLDDITDQVLETISIHVPCSLARIYLLDESGLQLCHHASVGAAPAGHNAERPCISRGDGEIVGWVADHREAYVTLDAQRDAFHGPSPGVSETLSEAAFPLVVGHRLVGVLDVHAHERDAFSPEDIEFLTVVGHWAGLILDHRHLTRVPSATVDALSRVSARLCAAATRTEVVDAIVDTVAATGAGTCLVAESLRGPDGTLNGLMCLGSWRRQGPARPAPGTRLPLSSAVFPIELLEGTWIVPDVASDARLSPRARELFDGMGVRGFVGFPLKGYSDCFGHVLVLYGGPGFFSTSTHQLYHLLEEQAGLALERASRLDETYKEARRAELIARATTRLHESLDLDAVLSTAVVDIAQTLGLAGLDVRLGPPPDDAWGRKSSRAEGPESDTHVARGEED